MQARLGNRRATAQVQFTRFLKDMNLNVNVSALMVRTDDVGVVHDEYS